MRPNLSSTLAIITKTSQSRLLPRLALHHTVGAKATVRLIEHTGQRFGLLDVLSRGPNKNGKPSWWCRCQADGNSILVCGESLRNGETRSCGCLFAEGTRLGFHRTHGQSKTREYGIWNSMKDRCCNPKAPAYRYYGGRGIQICNLWKTDYEAFYQSMGARPGSGYSIDRIDNDGGYWCGKCSECIQNGWSFNCRWATRKEQAVNRRPRTTATTDCAFHPWMEGRIDVLAKGANEKGL